MRVHVPVQVPLCPCSSTLDSTRSVQPVSTDSSGFVTLYTQCLGTNVATVPCVYGYAYSDFFSFNIGTTVSDTVQCSLRVQFARMQ